MFHRYGILQEIRFNSIVFPVRFNMIGDYLIRFGSFGIPTMGFCILIGTIFALLLCYFAKRYTVLDWNNEILDAIIWSVIGGFIGMKVLYWIVTPEYFLAVIKNPTWKGVWELITTGMVFYGGLIGGIAGALLFCWRRKINFFSLSDLILPCFCIAHSGGRIGCLLVGCCYGLAEGESCLGGFYTYHGACSVTYLNGVHRMPVPLMEAMFLVLLAAILILVLKNTCHRGTVTAWYMILYSIWRFVIEFFRGDAVRGIYGLFSTSQWIGIAIFLAGIVILVLSRKWPKDTPAAEFSSRGESVSGQPDESPDDMPSASDEAWAAPAPETSSNEPSEEPAAVERDWSKPSSEDISEQIPSEAAPRTEESLSAGESVPDASPAEKNVSASVDLPQVEDPKR